MIGSRLAELIEKNGIRNKTKVAKEIGITPQLFYKYENNLAEPPVDVIKKIADYFKISTDSLLKEGNGEDQSQYSESEINELSVRVSEQIILKLTNTNEKSLDHIIQLGNALIKISEKIADKL